ncbi:MAG: hypothetical protein QM770_19835 [Tepidisphaeraceae bacterium]
MSDFRNNLNAAREQYRSAKYPGDLVADLRDRQRMAIGPWLIGLGAMAAAACVAVVVWMNSSTSPIAPVIAENPNTTPTTKQADIRVAVDDQADGMDDFDTTFTVVPTAPSSFDTAGVRFTAADETYTSGFSFGGVTPSFDTSAAVATVDTDTEKTSKESL